MEIKVIIEPPIFYFTKSLTGLQRRSFYLNLIIVIRLSHKNFEHKLYMQSQQIIQTDENKYPIEAEKQQLITD